MNKAILVLEEMPAGCPTCQLCHLSVNYNARMCGAAKLEMAAKTGAYERRDDCPLQEVEPVRHGHWIKYDIKKSPHYWQCVECSECGHREPLRMELNRYCGGCGAKMGVNDGTKN